MSYERTTFNDFTEESATNDDDGDETAAETVYRYGCDRCGERFHTPEQGADCPDCGAKHPTNLGFEGDAELAARLEAADLPDDVNPQQLDAATAREVLERLEDTDDGDDDGEVFDSDECGRIKYHAEQGNLGNLLRCAGLPDMLGRKLIKRHEWETAADVFDGLVTPEALKGVGPSRAENLTAARALIGEAIGAPGHADDEADEAVTDGGEDDAESDAEGVLRGADRFPGEPDDLTEQDRVWIDGGVVRGRNDPGSSACQGCEVLESDAETVTVEYPAGGTDYETTTVAREHVRETDLEAGERVTVEYESIYTDDGERTEKTGTVTHVIRSYGDAFDGIRFEADDGTEYVIGRTGAVKAKSNNRGVGVDAVVTRLEDTDDEEDDQDAGEPVTDGGQDLPADETVRLITGIVGLMHTPEIVEGETSSSGKTISVEEPHGRGTCRLDTAEILAGESEYRDSTYFEVYTPKRLEKRQRANRAPGPQAGCNGVADPEDLPEPTHVPADEDAYPDDEDQEDAESNDQDDDEDVTEPLETQTWERADVFAVEGVGELLITRLDRTRTSPPTTTGAEAVDRTGHEYKLRVADMAGPPSLVVEDRGEAGAVVILEDTDRYPAEQVEYAGRNMAWLRDYISPDDDQDDDRDGDDDGGGDGGGRPDDGGTPEPVATDGSGDDGEPRGASDEEVREAVEAAERESGALLEAVGITGRAAEALLEADRSVFRLAVTASKHPPAGGRHPEERQPLRGLEGVGKVTVRQLQKLDPLAVKTLEGYGSPRIVDHERVHVEVPTGEELTAPLEDPAAVDELLEMVAAHAPEHAGLVITPVWNAQTDASQTCPECGEPRGVGEMYIARESHGFGLGNKSETVYCSRRCRAEATGRDVKLATTDQARLRSYETAETAEAVEPSTPATPATEPGGVDRGRGVATDGGTEPGPEPREHELPGGALAVVGFFRGHANDAVTVPERDRPLYRLLTDVLEGVHVPNTMPAVLATACQDLVDVRETMTDINRGHVDVGGKGYGMNFCHRIRNAIEKYRDRPPVRLAAVGCSGSKREDDTPLAAKQRYKGAYWSKKRGYGEAVAGEWRIISAEHGVLNPETPIAYYERTPDDLEGIPVDSTARLPSGEPVTTLLDRWALDVYEGLARWLEDVTAGVDPRDVALEVLLGRQYREPLEARGVFYALRAGGALAVSFPFQAVEQAQGGLFEQIDWMGDEIDATVDRGRGAETDGGPQVGAAPGKEHVDAALRHLLDGVRQRDRDEAAVAERLRELADGYRENPGLMTADPEDCLAERLADCYRYVEVPRGAFARRLEWVAEDLEGLTDEGGTGNTEAAQEVVDDAS